MLTAYVSYSPDDGRGSSSSGPSPNPTSPATRHKSLGGSTGPSSGANSTHPNTLVNWREGMVMTPTLDAHLRIGDVISFNAKGMRVGDDAALGQKTSKAGDDVRKPFSSHLHSCGYMADGVDTRHYKIDYLRSQLWALTGHIGTFVAFEPYNVLTYYYINYISFYYTIHGPLIYNAFIMFFHSISIAGLQTRLAQDPLARRFLAAMTGRLYSYASLLLLPAFDPPLPPLLHVNSVEPLNVSGLPSPSASNAPPLSPIPTSSTISSPPPMARHLGSSSPGPSSSFGSSPPSVPPLPLNALTPTGLQSSSSQAHTSMQRDNLLAWIGRVRATGLIPSSRLDYLGKIDNAQISASLLPSVSAPYILSQIGSTTLGTTNTIPSTTSSTGTTTSSSSAPAISQPSATSSTPHQNALTAAYSSNAWLTGAEQLPHLLARAATYHAIAKVLFLLVLFYAHPI